MYIRDFDDPDVEIAIKVVIVGDGGVGKSSMIQRYCRGTFTRTYKKTIGVDFLEKELRVQGENVRLMLWDTAGQEEFNSITRSYYRGAQACVLTFSTTDRRSLISVQHWLGRVRAEVGAVPVLLVMNKIDLIQDSQVNMSEVERISDRLGLRLYRVSVKDDLNVGTVFQHLAEDYVAKIREYDNFDPRCGARIGIPDPKDDVVVLGGTNRKTLRHTSGRGQRRVKFSSSPADPCHEYLNNPIFKTLQHQGKFRHKSHNKPSCKSL